MQFFQMHWKILNQAWIGEIHYLFKYSNKYVLFLYLLQSAMIQLHQDLLTM